MHAVHEFTNYSVLLWDISSCTFMHAVVDGTKMVEMGKNAEKTKITKMDKIAKMVEMAKKRQKWSNDQNG